jgi:hypothetical protein
VRVHDVDVRSLATEGKLIEEQEAPTKISASSPECNHWSRTQQKSLLDAGGRGLCPEPWEGKPLRNDGDGIAIRGGEEGKVTARFGGDEGAETST